MAKRKTNKELQVELAQVRLEREIAQQKLQVRLSEQLAYPFDVVNPWSQFYDGQNLIFPLTPSRWDNRTMSSGFWVTEAQLDLIRYFSRYLFDTNLIARGVVRSLENYIVKTGYEYTVTSKNKSESHVQDVQDFIDRFLEKNCWFERELDFFRRSRRDGEFFVRLFAQDDGIAEVRIVEPEQVRAFDASPEYLFGVHVEQDDRETVLGFWVTYTGVPSQASYVPSEEMSHYKINTDMVVRRGLSDFFCSQEALQQVQKLLRASVMGESVRQAISYVRQYEQADQSAVLALQSANTDYETPVVTGFGQTRFQATQHVEPGSVIDIPKGLAFQDGPKGAGANAVAILQAAYQTLSAYWQVPQWLISGDTGSTNYAASLTAESPFVRNCEKEQKLYSNKFKEIIVKALHIGVEQGVLSAEAIEQTNITVACPPVVVRNAKEESDRNKLLYDSGILSSRSWADREELDVETERENERLDAGDEVVADDAGLAGTVGGLQAIAELQKSYFAGQIARESARANVEILFQFTPEQSERLFPETTPQVLTQPGVDGSPSAPETTGEEQPSSTETKSNTPEARYQQEINRPE